MGISPSMGPMETKAPNSRTAVTVPFITIPSDSVAITSRDFRSSSSSSKARRETTMLRPFSPYFVIRNAARFPTCSS